MNKVVVSIILILVILTLSFIAIVKTMTVPIINPLAKDPTPKEKPLDKYTFSNLQKRIFTPSPIVIEDIIKEGNGYKSYLFFFDVDGKKVSGLLNVPAINGQYPLIVMLRGYVDQEKYTTGIGTQRAGEVFAQNGFITLAPDFLGYGKSDMPSDNAIEERFQTYTTALTLLASLPNLNKALQLKGINGIEAEEKHTFLWGHSNGGQITLSVLAISKIAYPAVLWNPVSKPFPYAILYYTDDFDDNGKALRRVVANFERDYDIEKYSPTNYFSSIQAPIQLNQAQDDEAVPLRWTDQLTETLKKLNKNVTYYTYPGENHNFNNGSWSTVILRNIAFYRMFL